MKIYEYEKGHPIEGRRIVALGYFDGVHAGHRHLIGLARALADKMCLPLAIFTFGVGGSLCKGGKSLYTEKQKHDLLFSLGADSVIVADFDRLKNLSAEEFITGALVSDMGCAGAVCGFDFRFGKGAVGNADLLAKTLDSLDLPCVVAEEQTLGGKKISTTRIKELLLGGEIEAADELLGVPYFIEGEVTRGDGRGRTLGFPTVNTEFEEERLCPRHGVYRSAVDIDGVLYSAVTNVGTCPTFGKRREHAETFIINYSGDLYGKNLRIFLLGYLREEKQFENAEELKMQINVDKNRAILENGELTWQEIGPSLQQKQA